MAYPEPNSLDDLYGPGAEDAAVPDESPAACERCGETFPDSALDSDGLCAECCFERHPEAKRRREEYFGLADDNPEIYDYSDADPGL